MTICAVIVTYLPERVRLRRAIAAVRGCVEHAVVVDNGSPGFDKSWLEGDWAPVAIVQHERNEGIAAAQNRGIAEARRARASHVLLLDQDSVADAAMVTRLDAGLRALERHGIKVACVAPEIVMEPGGAPASFLEENGKGELGHEAADSRIVECLLLISSGTLIPMAVLDDIGTMEEGLFIDVVDEEWCLRARGKGYRLFGVHGAVLRHQLGDTTRTVWAGRWRRAPRHKAFRYYYIFRNTLLLARRNYVPAHWTFRRLLLLSKLFLAYGVFAVDRRGELAMMLKGISHGLRGVDGRLQ